MDSRTFWIQILKFPTRIPPSLSHLHHHHHHHHRRRRRRRRRHHHHHLSVLIV